MRNNNNDEQRNIISSNKYIYNENTEDEIASFQDEDEENNLYMNKKELMHLENDKSITVDYSYDDDHTMSNKQNVIFKETTTKKVKSTNENGDTIKSNNKSNKKKPNNNTNNLMKYISDDTDYYKYTNNSNTSNINNLNNMNTLTHNPNNNIIITNENELIISNNNISNLNNNLLTSGENLDNLDGILQPVNARISNYLPNNTLTNNYNYADNTNLNINSITNANNNNEEHYYIRQINTKSNNNSKMNISFNENCLTSTRFEIEIIGKNISSSLTNSLPSFGIQSQSISQLQLYEKKYKELENQYKTSVDLLSYWQNFYLSVVNIIGKDKLKGQGDDDNGEEDDYFGNEYRYRVIEKVKELIGKANCINNGRYGKLNVIKEINFNIIECDNNLMNRNNLNLNNQFKYINNNDIIMESIIDNFYIKNNNNIRKKFNYNILNISKNDFSIINKSNNIYNNINSISISSVSPSAMVNNNVLLNSNNSMSTMRKIKFQPSNSVSKKKTYNFNESIDMLPPMKYTAKRNMGINTDINMGSSNTFSNLKIENKNNLFIIKGCKNFDYIDIDDNNKININYLLRKNDLNNENSFLNLQKIDVSSSLMKINYIKKLMITPKVNNFSVISSYNNNNNFNKKMRPKPLRNEQNQTTLTIKDINKYELLSEQCTNQLNKMQKEYEEKINKLSEENSNLINNSNNTNANSNSNNNSSKSDPISMLLPEMIPPEQTYKIFMHCVKHFKYEEELYKKYMEDKDLKILKNFVNKMENYIKKTSYPCTKIRNDINHVNNININLNNNVSSNNVNNKKIKENVISGLKPIKNAGGGIGGNNHEKNSICSIQNYNNFGINNERRNNSTFNKYKAAITSFKKNNKY